MARHIESRLQSACVEWFRLQYKPLAKLLFAVPNGGFRNATEGRIMKGEGVTAGVADLILLVGNIEYNSLCIEMKTSSSKSKQTDNQKEWQALAESHGNKYVVCRSFEEFQNSVREYFHKRE